MIVELVVEEGVDNKTGLRNYTIVQIRNTATLATGYTMTCDELDKRIREGTKVTIF